MHTTRFEGRSALLCMPHRFHPLAFCVGPPLPCFLYVYRKDKEASEDEISWSLRGTEVACVPTGMVNMKGRLKNVVVLILNAIGCITWTNN
jgi:hypothetical protein